MKAHFLKKPFWFGLALTTPVLPLALAATCGSKSSNSSDAQSTTIDPTSFLTSITQIAPSTNTAVTWSRGFNAAKNETPALPPGIKSIEFVVGNHPTEDAANIAYATQKTLALPPAVDPDNTKRFVWAFLKPEVGYRLLDGKEVFDLTNTSGIKNITTSTVQNIVIDPATFLATIQQITPSTSAAVTWTSGFNAAKNETPKLPTGYQSLEFVIGDYQTEPLAQAAYPAQKVLALPSTVGVEGAKRFLWAFLKPATGYQFTNNKLVYDLTDTSGIKNIVNPVFPDVIINPESFLNTVVSIAPSTSAAVNWTSGFNTAKNETPKLPTGYQSLEFVIGDYQTEPLAQNAYNANKKVTALPSIVDTDSTKRFLWAFLKPAAGYQFTNNKLVYDLTASSGIKNIPNPVIPDVVINPTSFLNTVMPIAPSYSTAVTWTPGFNAAKNETPKLPTGYQSLEFVIGDYSSEPLAQSAYNENKKVTALPSTVDTDSTKRFLWAFIKPATGYQFTNNKLVYDLTNSSGIKYIFNPAVPDVVVNPLDFLNTIQQKTPSTSAAVIWTDGFNAAKNETPKLPTGYQSLEFLIGNYPNQTAVDAASAGLRVRSLPAVVDSDYTKRFLWAFVKPATGYKFLDNKEVYDLTDSSRLKIMANAQDTIIDPATFLATIKQVPPSTNAIVNWPFGFNAVNKEVPDLQPGYQSLEFVIGDYPTKDAAIAAYPSKKVTTLPEQIGFDYTKRFLWAFVKPKSGYQLKDNQEVYDLTISSEIQTLFGVMRNEKLYADFFTAITNKVIITGPNLTSATVDLSKFTIPPYMTISYSGRDTVSGIAFSPRYQTIQELMTWVIGRGFDTPAKIASAIPKNLTLYVNFDSADKTHYYMGENANIFQQILMVFGITP